MPNSRNRSRSFLAGVAVSFVVLSCLVIIQPRAATRKLDASPPEKSGAEVNDKSDAPMSMPKRRPIQAAVGWGEVGTQLERANTP